MDLSFKDSVRIGTTQRVLNVKIELQMINNSIVLNRQVSEFGPTATIPRINSRTMHPLCGRSFEDGSWRSILQHRMNQWRAHEEPHDKLHLVDSLRVRMGQMVLKYFEGEVTREDGAIAHY